MNQSVLITGGSRGIGYATAQAFLARGACVTICATDAERLRAAEQALGVSGDVAAVVADVRNREQLEHLVATARTRFGRIDVLVNNAGTARFGGFASQDLEGMDAVIDVNVKGLLHVTRLVLPEMLERRAGVIINVASGAGLSGFPGLAVYCASKFAIVGFTESLDIEVRDAGVRVYGVCPGRVATDMQVQYAGRRIGLPPSQVAERVVALAGVDPRARTGTCVTVP